MNLKKALTISLILFSILICNFVNAQNAYIQTDIMKVAATTDAQINALTIAGKQTTYEYLNGLGTSAQKVISQESLNSQDIIQVYQYDQFAQQSANYLPYVDNNTSNNNGSYRANALNDQQSYYINNNTPGNLNKVANDPLPFSQQLFENSPLRRLLAAGNVGLGFQPNLQDNNQHYSTINYRNNTSADNVMIAPASGSTTAYLANALSVTDMKDADGVETILFKNTQGQSLLKRQVSGQTTEPFYDTYYVYNANGSIAYIIPPKAAHLIATGSSNILAVPLSNLIYAYTYDILGRVITRKAPNTGIVNIVYDPMNRPILVQDGNRAASGVNQWYYIKYDAKSRPISQGIYQDNTNIGQYNMQTYVNNNYGTNYYESRSGNAATFYYTNNCFPNQNIQQLAFAFYDDYDLAQTGSPYYNYQSQGLVDGNGNSIEAAPTTFTRGMLTMVLKRSVGTGLNNIWLSSILFYDKHGNTIQTQSNNHLNFTQNVVTDYRTATPDFTGKALQTKVVKVTGSGVSNTNSVLSSYNYDSHNERVQSISQSYNNQTPVTIASYSYNDLGQLVTKQLGFVVNGVIPTTQNLSTTYSGINTIAASNSITMSTGFNVPTGSTFKAEITTNNYLQTLDYRFNIRGQLLTINNSTLTNDNGVTNNDNNDLFGMQYLYDNTDPSLGNSKPSYTGQVSAVKWMYKYNNTNTSNERSYVYQYDQLKQLNSALYAERTPGSLSSTLFSVNPHGFDETGITYDDDGNITALQRNYSTNNGSGGMPLDKLAYTYDTNNPDRLYQVSDNVTATGQYGFNNIAGATSSSYYQYDADGNLTSDPYKGISITYNLLNKTDVINVPNISNSTISYTYDASGEVLKKQSSGSSGTSTNDYIDEFVYTNGALSYFAMPEGRVVNSGGTLKPEYVISDLQGNARLSFQDNGSGVTQVMQENSFYAYGEVMPNSLVPTVNTANPNIYNGGSEWQNTFQNLPDYYQSGARNYDPALGRFVSVDPMAEATESLTNYHYALNNPIMGNDPSGNCDNCDIPGQWIDPGVGDDFGGANEPNNIDTGGGGGGDPGVDYSGDNVPSTSTSEGGVYNNSTLGITPYTSTYTTSTSNTGNDGTLNISFSPTTRSGYFINDPGHSSDGSSITISTDIQGTIPNVDLIGESTGGTDGTASQGGSEEEEPAWGSTVTLTHINYTGDLNNGVVNTHIQGYSGKIIGKEGKYGTFEWDDSFRPAGSYNLGFIGTEISNDEISINFNFGKGSYKFGISGEGFYEDDSYSNGGLINGMRYTYSIDPKGAAITGAVSAAGTYIFNAFIQGVRQVESAGQ